MSRGLFAFVLVFCVVFSQALSRQRPTDLILEKEPSLLERYFDRFLDIDDDGSVDATEIMNFACGHSKEKICGKESQLLQVLNRYDADGSGLIDKKEFLSTLNRQIGDPIESGVQQVHLALTQKPSEMVVMWVTRDKLDSIVQYGLASANSLTNNATGSIATYDVGVDGWRGWVHKVTLTGLQAATKYSYRCGSDGSWSQQFVFTTAPDNTADPNIANEEFHFAVVADQGTAIPMGWAVTDQIAGDHHSEHFNMIIHAGDVCYAGTGSTYEVEEIWDVWGDQTEKIASTIPYMFAVGNHEHYYNFTSFLTRYNMPGPQCGGESNFWYSIDYGNVHFVFMSTEHDYDVGSAQHTWLVQDLTKANNNRKITPWIVVSGHRPMYNSDIPEWNQHSPGAHFQVTMEPVFHQFGVNLYLCGHMHMYERIHPVLNGTVTNTGNVYKNPVGVPHVVQATAGVFTDKKYVQPQPTWSAVRNDLWGYGRLYVKNATHLQYRFMDLTGNKVVDEFWIEKDL